MLAFGMLCRPSAKSLKKTGHSPHKIRRLIKAIADDPAHPDRSQIETSIDDVASLTAAVCSSRGVSPKNSYVASSAMP